jgi:hypothetical protein
VRVSRVGPTVAVIVLFLVISSALLIWIRGGATPPAGDPIDEAWLVFYAMRLPVTPPETLDQEGFRLLLAEFHPDAEHVATRFQVLSYAFNGGRYELELRHVDGTVFRVSLGGVRRG